GKAGAGGHGHGWIAQCGEDVPGCGDREEEREAGEGMEQAPPTPLAGEDEEETDGGEEEDDRDEALGEHGAGEGAPHEPGPGACVRGGGVECAEGAVDREREKKREQSVGDEDAGEEEDAGGGEDEETCVKSCAV